LGMEEVNPDAVQELVEAGLVKVLGAERYRLHPLVGRSVAQMLTAQEVEW